MIRTRLTRAALGLACLTAIAQPTAAQIGHVPDTWEVYSRDSTQIERATVIHLADLDLSSAAGVQALFGRIQTAAEAVCGGPASAYSDASRKQYGACRRKSIADAVARMRLSALTQYAAHAGDAALAGR